MTAEGGEICGSLISSGSPSAIEAIAVL